MGDQLLDIKDVTVVFGGISALSGVTFSAEEGRVTSVIGPNGAGKTSLFNVISGFYPATRGSVSYAGIDLLAIPSHRRSAEGIARTFQNLALFPGLSVIENIKLGAHSQLSAGLLSSAVYFGRAHKEEAAVTAHVDDRILPMLDLEVYRDRPVSGLPYGVLKRIELARALVSNPRLLMLDEPFAGMNPAEKLRLAGHISGVVEKSGITALLIDHDMKSVMELSDLVVVLNFGEVIAVGPPAQMQRNRAVIEAYLGEE